MLGDFDLVGAAVALNNEPFDNRLCPIRSERVAAIFFGGSASSLYATAPDGEPPPNSSIRQRVQG